MTALLRLRWIWLLALLLTACSPSNDESTQGEISAAKSQAAYFLESLKLVEQSGRQLQSSDPTQALVDQALSGMDAGLKLAFEVDTAFLNKLDVRLGKNYQRYFVEGVQAYRIGIEAADQSEQRRGLSLLNRWAQFWSTSQSAIQQKLQAQP
ncbi:MAG: hypothetical protein ACI9KN_000476 [Gammaproteobacteria bacterium]